jgi:hypothetical protein
VVSVLFGEIRPVPPAPTPHASIAGWVLLAVILALVVAGGMVLSSRR